MEEVDINQVNLPIDVGDISDSKWDYSKYVAMLKCFGAMFNQAAYIYNFEKEEIIHFEGNHSFYNFNYETDSKGYVFYERRVHEDDLPLLTKITGAVFDFLHVLPYNRKKHACISSNFRMKGHIHYKLINHKLVPLELADNGLLRVALCVIVPSVVNSPGNVYIRMCDTLQVYEYISSHNKFIETKNQRLSSQEFAVLELAAMGNREAEIAEILKIAKSTVKYHKREIFKRLGVNNISAAIQWYNNHKCY